MTTPTNPRRCAAKEQVVLVKMGPHAENVMAFLSSCGPYNCKKVENCPVDLMFCAQAQTFPAVPFIFVSSSTSDPVASTTEKARLAITLFPFVHVIVLFPSALSPRIFRELQLLHFEQDLSDKMQIVSASSFETAVHFMLSVRSKRSHLSQQRNRAFYDRLWAQVESKAHAVQILQSNMPFLHEDECEMLLDVFGSIATLSHVSEQEFLDQTVLDADVIQLVVEYFSSDRASSRRITGVDAKRLSEVRQNHVEATSPASPRDAATTQAMCQRRVNLRVVQDMVLKNRILEENESKKARNHEVSLRAAHNATERIKAKKRQELKALDDGVEVLILNQPSSIEAMNIARMLSPRFAETINYSPDIAKHSADEVRLKTLLQSDRIGSYYR